MSNNDKSPKQKNNEPVCEKTAEEIVNEAIENAAADEQGEAQTIDDKVQEMGEKLAEMNDKYIRLYSEYENYRKRTNQEKADLVLNGGRDFMKAILPVIDDFERALAALGNDEGVLLIYNKMIKILEQKGLKAMEAKGAKFDEALHEAVTRIPAPSADQKGLVMDVVEKGYFLNDKVLRYAKVVVAC